MILKKQNCGSGLARDGGLTDDDDVAWHSVIAGKPAPTGIFADWTDRDQ
jgi:hypothetical protein